jgi:hypothetical protein
MYVSYHRRGMGQDTTSPFATLFASTDFTQWGIGEWALIGLGIYVAAKLFSDVSRGTRKVKRSLSSRRKRGKKKQSLLRQLEKL